MKFWIGLGLLTVVATPAALSLAATTAGPAPIVYGAQPVVSPSGDRIAFLSNRAGTEDVYLISASGRDEMRLTSTPEAEAGLQWSADGKDLVFSTPVDSGSRILAIDRKGRQLRQLGLVPGRTPMLAPDGAQVLFMAGTWTATVLTVSRLDGGQARPITDGSSIAWNSHWSPDGRRIAFTGRPAPEGELAVFVMNADGSGKHQLTHIPVAEGGAQWPAWSPDGRRLALQVNGRAQKGTAHIWVVDVATGEASKLAAHDAAWLDETPSWFPDGKRIAFQSNRSGRMEVWVMDADGSAPRQVTGSR